ncbi:MAG: TPR repeat containing exported protein; Putative periplasmic protein contains a protein prenylyltransferase domain [uncultured Thiotrichaceae bacterium]|uniref:Cell division coordinator CpoB n=1 Tax=uncultured Thiotrichaceae bacterium TaxID=298394 RepID=A0A6S6SH92_9GAMM|nr:MAG: TPR repeat containing exported protein; Putative periplasmic protein contains a protein prenylyltransferase domain [uncultured Thiotrichaceae bacterium]
MSGNVNRGLLSASLLIAMTAVPMAHAVSDEVAVQLLERLGELEKEVSGLRGENETLRNELQGIKTIQREGFLDVDERVSGLENPVSPVAVMPTEPVRIADPIELPALEDPVLQRELQPSAMTRQPLNSTISVSTADRQVSDPDDRKAVAPAVEFSSGSTGKSTETVDPASPESYYFYGTEDKNQEKGAATATTVDKTTVPRVASTGNAALPDAQKAKAEYNQAYRALVNDPGAAVPAFRTFLRKYPDHELAANAQYWLGEALYAQKNYSGATQEFMVVLKKHKSSPKAPGAALKLGYSFYELKQWDFARRTLEDTIRFFPDSNAAGLAKQRLEKITAEGH